MTDVLKPTPYDIKYINRLRIEKEYESRRAGEIQRRMEESISIIKAKRAGKLIHGTIDVFQPFLPKKPDKSFRI